ncbi:MAG: hypothetical protein N2712_03415 [Brevinematales bacterium]|nr:hypothetical protein [Brevinematales bacterium]
MITNAFTDEFDGIVIGKFLPKTMDNTVKIFIKGSKMKSTTFIYKSWT